MPSFIIFIIEIALLWRVSSYLSRILSAFLRVSFLALLFLPGVIVHELSHFLLAVILLVPVGDINLIPQKTEDGIRLGSVEIEKTDMFRRLLIGGAPVFIGISLFALFGYFWLYPAGFEHNLLVKALSFYFLLTLGNTMFSSRKDMEGALQWVILLVVGASILWFLKIPIPVQNLLQTLLAFRSQLMDTINLLFFFVLVVDLTAIFLLVLLKKHLRR